jgi:hypothetical protein
MALRDLKDASGHRPYKCEEARLRSSTLNPIEEGASAMAHSKHDIESEADKFDDPLSWYEAKKAAAEGKAAPKSGGVTEEDLWREYERKRGLRALIAEWVWVSTLGRYMNRSDPTVVLKKDQFNDKYRWLSGGHLLTNFLHARRKDTILKPDKVVYRPNQAEFPDGGREWNLWRPSEIKAAAGDTSMWDGHLAYLWPDLEQRRLVLDWMAAVLQRLEVKPMHALLMLGPIPGTGKSWLAAALAKLIGDGNWTALTQEILARGFTGWAMRTKLAVVEELRLLGKTELVGSLHPWITQREIMVDEKNLPGFMIDQVIAFVMMSNRLDAIKLDMGDRRYLVVKTEAVPHPDGDAYYVPLYGMLEDKEKLGAVLHQLMTRDLKGYNICGRAPETVAKGEMKRATVSDLALWMAENGGEEPYSYQAVTMKEIEDALPKRIRVGTRLMKEAMEDRGYWRFPEQIHPGGRAGKKRRVWLGPGVARGLTTGEVQQLYKKEREERAKAEMEEVLNTKGEDVKPPKGRE